LIVPSFAKATAGKARKSLFSQKLQKAKASRKILLARADFDFVWERPALTTGKTCFKKSSKSHGIYAKVENIHTFKSRRVIN